MPITTNIEANDWQYWLVWYGSRLLAVRTDFVCLLAVRTDFALGSRSAEIGVEDVDGGVVVGAGDGRLAAVLARDLDLRRHVAF